LNNYLRNIVMSKINIVSLVAVIGLLIGTAGTGFAFDDYGKGVNTACAPLSPYTDSGCFLCHASYSKEAPTAAKDAYLAGGKSLTGFFCPSSTPPCYDNDGDGYSSEGADCGAFDCNDDDTAVNPGAPEVCTDGFDNDCDDLVDKADPNAVGCPVPDLDNDGDGFTVTEGDCDDTEFAANQVAVEFCTDGIDNNCNGLVDTQDPEAIGCPKSCIDYDGDNYSFVGGECGQIDCDDTNPFINPGAEELCGDSRDNDCDELVDEGCDPTCPDEDGDNYQNDACGGNDCDDTNAFINPGVAEVCGDGVDANCNGYSDESCHLP
jgi:hypothetical protein